MQVCAAGINDKPERKGVDSSGQAGVSTLAAAGKALLELTHNEGLKLHALIPALQCALQCRVRPCLATTESLAPSRRQIYPNALTPQVMQATRQATLSAIFARLFRTSKLQVSAFLMSLVFGSASLAGSDRKDASGAHCSNGHELWPMECDGSVPELATHVSSILPMLIDAGMVDQQFAWPLLRVLSAPASSSAHVDGAAILLSLFRASNDQARSAMECTQKQGGRLLSESVLVNIQAFMGGHSSKAGARSAPAAAYHGLVRLLTRACYTGLYTQATSCG